MIDVKKRWSERRESRRLEFPAKAFIVWCNEKSSCKVINISGTGAFIETNLMYEVNDAVELIITFENSTVNLSVSVPAKVIRIGAKGIGVVSPHIDTNQLLQLELLFDCHGKVAQQLITEFSKFAATA